MMKRTLIVRLTKNQHERVKNNAESKGYKTISSYIRSLALEHDLGFVKKFDEIYTKLIDKNSDKAGSKDEIKLTRFL